MHIATIKGREILDSRGFPTVQADVILSNGVIGRAAVPSGASTGSREACELRDGDLKRYNGKGVSKAVHHVNHLIHQQFQDFPTGRQQELDEKLCLLDGTENKSHLGANAILAVSLAYARATALAQEKPLFLSLNQEETMCMPVPMMNILNGGAHADNNVDIQEFMIMPVGAPDFPMALQMGSEIFHALKQVLKNNGSSTAVGDEGGFAPDLQSNRQALDLLSEAVHLSGYKVGEDVLFALDVAASELYEQGFYHLRSEQKTFRSEELIEYYQSLLRSYPIISIEDGLDESDWDGWKLMTKTMGDKIQLVGDDLFATNPKILKEGVEKKAANTILVKLNQIGTLTETREAIKLAHHHNYNCIISHRSGETEDHFIADLAVATGCGQIKTGSLCRSDRIAKYNQLLRINEMAALPYNGKLFIR